MKLVADKISLSELREMAENGFGDLVKAVVDIERGIMVVDAGLHADEERMLLEDGSKQENLWGINIYPENKGKDLIEFDSMINIRPMADNRTRGVEDSAIREKIFRIVTKLIK